MKKLLKYSLIGAAAVIALATPGYPQTQILPESKVIAGENKPVQDYLKISREISELKTTIKQIVGYGPSEMMLKKLNEENYEYSVFFPGNSSLELSVDDYDNSKQYHFIDEESDGILDSYRGSKEFVYTKKAKAENIETPT